MPTHAGPLAERFWAKVRKSDGCWEWTAHCNTTRHPYGRILVGSRRDGTRRMATAHRVSWELHFGAIPEGMCVCHRCDNPRCVRPDHLFLGTQIENIADMKAKKRARSVGARTRAKLTWADVDTIRSELARGALQEDLARRFGVRQPAISDIKHNKKWKREAANG